TKARTRMNDLYLLTQETFGFDIDNKQNVLNQFVQQDHIGGTIDFVRKTLHMSIMTIFFVVLWLAESINLQKVLNSAILKQRHTSVKTFFKIEKDLIKFIKVKFFISLATGIGTGLACVLF